LEELRDNDVRLGIVSNVGQEPEENVRRVLEEAGLYGFFEPGLLVYGEKDSPEIFRYAAERAGHSATPERCLYVSPPSEGNPNYHQTSDTFVDPEYAAEIARAVAAAAWATANT
jgi:hypothetical protein